MLTKQEKKILRRAHRARLLLASVTLCDRAITNHDSTFYMKSMVRKKRQRDWKRYLSLLPSADAKRYS